MLLDWVVDVEWWWESPIVWSSAIFFWGLCGPETGSAGTAGDSILERKNVMNGQPQPATNLTRREVFAGHGGFVVLSGSALRWAAALKTARASFVLAKMI